MQSLEKRITGLSFRKGDAVADNIMRFVQSVADTSGFKLGEGEGRVLKDLKRAVEVLVKAGAFAGLRLDLGAAQVMLKADYWQVDGTDDCDVCLLGFLFQIPDKIGLTIMVEGDQALLKWLGVESAANQSAERLGIRFEVLPVGTATESSQNMQSKENEAKEKADGKHTGNQS